MSTGKGKFMAWAKETHRGAAGDGKALATGANTSWAPLKGLGAQEWDGRRRGSCLSTSEHHPMVWLCQRWRPRLALLHSLRASSPLPN